MSEPLPIDFFTIVINGLPFIRHHIEAFSALPFPWHWHIIEGLAAHRHDTAWGARRGGTIPQELGGVTSSTDGTTEYLEELQRRFPSKITLYRKPAGQLWDGKIEMVNAPLSNLRRPCILWQVDADELWTVEQIVALHRLFVEQPARTAAWFACRYFFSPDLCTERWNVYGNFLSSEWLRVWRFEPGDHWMSHEPPRLYRPQTGGPAVDVGRIQPFTHAETAKAGLIFQHFAYATEAQVRFKESYYGYPGAVTAWRRFVKSGRADVRLRNVLPWVWEAEIGSAHTLRTLFRWLASPVLPAARAECIRSKGLIPLAQHNLLGQWRFYPSAPPVAGPLTLLLLRADRIGDNVLSLGLLAGLRGRFPWAKLVVACPDDVRELYEHRPEVDELVTFDRALGHRSARYRRSVLRVLRHLQADLAINPQFSRDKLSGLLMVGCGAKRKVGFDAERRRLRVSRWRQFQAAFDQLVPVAETQSSELAKYDVLAKALDFSGPLPRPSVPITPADDDYAQAALATHNLSGRKLVALILGSAQAEKVFSGYGLALRESLPKDMAIVALGTASEAEANAAELQAIEVPVLNLCGQTTLRQAAALLKRCTLAVGADTGLSHIACAVGCRQVIVLGGGDFGRYFPYSPLTSVVSLPLACYQCQWFCRFSQPHCIRQIKPEVLAEAIRQTLSVDSTKPRVFFQSQEHVLSYAAGEPRPAWQLPPARADLDWEVHII
jgi:ADP-heptose:LPS heptosyltransferase